MSISRFIYVLIFSTIFIITSLNSSCVEEPLTLDSKQLKLVDTLVKHQTIQLRAELDSLCDLHFEEEVERATDSLVIVRIAEINKKLGK